ncbi:TatD family hydrolase [Chloroflexota bacterium]
MVFSDSHCHPYGAKPEWLAEVLKQAEEKHVDILIGMGGFPEAWEETISLAQSHPRVLAGVGVLPWLAVPPPDEVRQQIIPTWRVVLSPDEVRQQLRKLAGRKGVVVIGEVGLQYGPNHFTGIPASPETKEVQKELFRYELSLARETGLPLNIVSSGGSHQDMMDILHQEISPDLKGYKHGPPSDLTELKDWLNLGFYVSVGVRGFVTDTTPALLEVVGDIPLDRLLILTDFNAREERGSPADIVSVAEKLASLRGTTVEEIADITTANLKRLLKL